MGRKHYIGMAGISGCLPSTCDVYETRTAAARELATIHDRGKNWAKRLARDRYADLRPEEGNEYAEIVECDCDTPEVHSDSSM
jgi:hypothetical protein